MSEIKLAPCPFCGFEGAKVLTGFQVGDNDNAGDYAVFCAYYDGGCGSASGYRKSREDAVELWNGSVKTVVEEGSPQEPMKRDAILSKAMETVCGEREEQYGSPEDNFSKIAELWTTYLDDGEGYINITKTDVSIMMILLKIARIAGGKTHQDNWIDIAGYAACGGEIDGKEDKS